MLVNHLKNGKCYDRLFEWIFSVHVVYLAALSDRMIFDQLLSYPGLSLSRTAVRKHSIIAVMKKENEMIS